MALALVSSRPNRPRYEFTVGTSRMRFYLGDCLSVLPALEPQSVGVVVTSPPYNLGIKYRSLRGRHAADGVPELDRSLASRACRG